jgi:hypothetical protein
VRAAQPAAGHSAEESKPDSILRFPMFFHLLHSSIAKIQDLGSTPEILELSGGSNELIYQVVQKVKTRMK